MPLLSSSVTLIIAFSFTFQNLILTAIDFCRGIPCQGLSSWPAGPGVVLAWMLPCRTFPPVRRWGVKEQPFTMVHHLRDLR